MLSLGKALAQQLPKKFTLYLHGELGAGKTTLVRGILRGLGYQGKVKSPTYTFVEPYHLNDQTLYHFDLYRLRDVTELEDIAVRDYFTETAVILIEWPEVGVALLPNPDLRCYIEINNQQRILKCEAYTNVAATLLSHLI